MAVFQPKIDNNGIGKITASRHPCVCRLPTIGKPPLPYRTAVASSTDVQCCRWHRMLLLCIEHPLTHLS